MNRNQKAARKKRAREEKRQARALGVVGGWCSISLSPIRPPDDEVKGCICGAVRRVVFEQLPDALAGKLCIYVNGTAYGVLSTLDSQRRLAWRLRAGTASVETGAVDDEGPLAVGYDFDMALAEGRATEEFHVWAVGNVGPEMHAVDFTTPDFKLVADRLGVPWARDAPPYIWGNAEAVASQGAQYGSHPVATDIVERIWVEQRELFVQMTRRALDVCAAQGVTRLYY